MKETKELMRVKGMKCLPVAACAPHTLSVVKKGEVLASLLPGGPFTCSQNKVFKLLILPF